MSAVFGLNDYLFVNFQIFSLRKYINHITIQPNALTHFYV